MALDSGKARHKREGKGVCWGRRKPENTVPPPLSLVGAASAPPPPGDLGAALVGRTVLYWYPDDGWQRGAVPPSPATAPAVPSRTCGTTPGRRRR